MAALIARADSPRIKTLFLGDNGHHQPAERASELMPALAKVGIDVAYTDDLADLNPANLTRYDALIIYANHPKIAPEQEKALLDFVEGGKGLVVLHCGSYCFLNSPKYIALVGGQFKSHGTGEFRAKILKPDHPALKGVEEFEAWDETYIHHKLSDDRDVLMVREEGDRREPWTWVRTQGRGRVFYTASGHDERVFTHPGYHRLVAQGIRWAVGRPDFTYVTVPFSRSPGELPDYLGDFQSKGRKGSGRLHDMQDPVSVAESMKHLSVPGGFRVELFASEPQIVKPICIAWDDRGRAWVAETVDYPNDKHPPGQGHDKITICEDTDGDGKADKFTVFADKLSIPTSMVFVNGGLIVSQAPEMLFLKDTDGDDKADIRRVLFTGFHTDDTHAGPSNLRLGLDNWIYATIGYAGFEGVVGGQRHRFRQGIFRFQPDGSKLEVLTSSSNNTWGLGITETGEILYSTANGEHSSYLGVPNRAFESVRGWLGKGNDRMADHTKMHPLTKIRQVDWFGGYTAAAGHAPYTARQFPQPFWNRIAFVCEPTGHLVHMCLLERRGSHFVTRDRFNLLASTDEWTAPVAAEVGPDGAVWVLDWYNYIVQHNPTPLGFETGKGNAYVTPLRDKTHGRIYRVINQTAPLGKPLDLASASPDELVAALKNDNMFWRLIAQWKLVERGKADVVPALAELAHDLKTDATGENLPAIHALWALHGLGAFAKPEERTTALLDQSLRHASAGVRKAAVEVLPRDERSVRAVLKAQLLADQDPFVRRAALLVLSELPASDEAGAAVLAMLRRPENAEDRWIPLAATSAGARHDDGFLAAALDGRENPEAVRKALRVVAEHYARGDEVGSLPKLLALLGKAPASDTEAFLEGLAAGWPKGKAPRLDEATQAGLITLMDRLGPSGQLHLAALAGRWEIGSKFEKAMATLRDRLASEVADAQRPEAVRIEAAQRLAQMSPDAATLDRLLAEVSAKASPTLAAGLLDAIRQAPAPDLGRAIIARWGQLTPQLRRQALDALLQRPEWTKDLIAALEQGTIAVTDLGAEQAQRLASLSDQALARRARSLLDRGGQLPSPDRQKVLAELLPLTEKTGDPAKGREVFQKNCAQCHRLGDLGAKIGPDLTGFFVHPKAKILTEIIDPNRSVEGNYRQYTVATTSGTVYSGLLASETKTAIELVDSEAKRHVILRDDIDEIIASTKSLMPEGLEKQIQPEEFVDLLEFLTAKGKFLPLPLDKAATIVSTRGMFHSKDARAERLIFSDWGPKTVAGIPFRLIDPQGDRVPNVILLHGPNGTLPPTMPRSVRVPCNAPAQAIHLLSGVSGWGYPNGREGTVSMIVRLHYQDGTSEDHPLLNGVHFADYIRRVDVPGSQLAFLLRNQQVRYLAIRPKRTKEPIREIEFVKGEDQSAPIVVAVTVESPE
ncbi:MAG: ThuA domain-containing protein [Isosphaeraceae bacterium]|nr:ThuA domain-containing protein [Isosphaeraceae bacterium]